jgi:hypothetical protein
VGAQRVRAPTSVLPFSTALHAAGGAEAPAGVTAAQLEEPVPGCTSVLSALTAPAVVACWL